MAHIFRHGFTTHLRNYKLDFRQIQVILGHGWSKTMEIYSHVATNTFKSIENPLD
ncbi:tyrosine-type recombinase/integrase [Maribacter cobaltidurans]|uniref:tyrosine-type recombinase/integrase n=1 Tax=Maribacter cobaltidurans TaxID=1178778 RepID=UPI0027E56B4D|nr:tyrosine-type recombinase/integrase [Maribacter cobaltidurans]